MNKFFKILIMFILVDIIYLIIVHYITFDLLDF